MLRQGLMALLFVACGLALGWGLHDHWPLGVVGQQAPLTGPGAAQIRTAPKRLGRLLLSPIRCSARAQSLPLKIATLSFCRTTPEEMVNVGLR